MKLLTNENQWKDGATAVAFGSFDGIHIGHRRLLQEARTLAQENGLSSMAYTYSNHPMQAFRPDAVPLQLETRNEKVLTLHEMGMDAAVLRPFTKEYAAQPPRIFVENICQAIHPRFVIIGFNYSFGDRGMGRAEDMIRFGRELGFETHVMEAVELNGETVSSTRIRAAVTEGRMEEVTEMLTHPYTISGKTGPGRQLGSKLGFPTANIPLPFGKALPAYGVYACLALVREKWYHAAVNIGNHPTVPGQPSIEAHLLDYDGGALYGEKIRVCFLKHTRGEIRFDSLEALRAQVDSDKLTVRSYFAKNPVYNELKK